MPAPVPAPVPVPPTPPPVSVNVTGPSQVASGDFVVVAIGSVSEGAESTWGYDPDPGPEHRAVFVEPTTGRQLVVFIQAPAGVYHLTLVGQMVTEGKDPTDAATKMVTVGKVPPPPIPPPDPDVPVPPPLTGTAKAAYDAVMRIQSPTRAAEAVIVAGVYRGVASSGAATDDMTPAEMSRKLAADMKAALTPAQLTAWKPAGTALAAIVAAAPNRDAMIAELNAIADGVEVVR